MTSANGSAGATARTVTAGQNGLAQNGPSYREQLDGTIATLAELFPAVFVADPRQPHRPLKVGVHLDLIELGVLLPDECRAVFRRYVSRRQYQKVLAAGGARYDLDGNVVGEVTPEQKAGAAKVLAQINAKLQARREAERATAAPSPAPPPPSPAPAAAPRQLGLADLKRMAQERRAGASQSEAAL